MKRSKFSLSHYKLQTMKMGLLVPCGLVEVLPGDSVQQATSALIRCSPMLAPVMHPVHVRIHHWFVPHRLVWDAFEDFITGGPMNTDATPFPVFRFNGSLTKGGLLDHYGVPPGSYTNFDVSALPIRGYNLIWNEWYRDQDLQTERVVWKGNGIDVTTDVGPMQNVAWEKDYFTTARPWAQKGAAVTLPFAGNAAVIKNPAGARPFFNLGGADFGAVYGQVSSEGAMQLAGAGVPGSDQVMNWGDTTGLVANMATATSITVNDLREALALQRYAEARARYGSRYTEYLRYLGVRSSDARLQRPEYLGGGKQTIQFSEVLQTGPGGAGGDEGVADLYGHGIGALRSRRYRRFFEEHGYIHSFISVKPKTMYTAGVARTWNRRTKEDFFQRELQHIGQQEILNREVYAFTNPQGVFGYQDRYDEYRRSESGISGDFRDTLSHWHFARMFGSGPVLNADFVKSDPAVRPFADQTGDVLWCMINHSIQARRMLAQVGTSMTF